MELDKPQVPAGWVSGRPQCAEAPGGESPSCESHEGFVCDFPVDGSSKELVLESSWAGSPCEPQCGIWRLLQREREQVPSRLERCACCSVFRRVGVLVVLGCYRGEHSGALLCSWLIYSPGFFTVLHSTSPLFPLSVVPFSLPVFHVFCPLSGSTAPRSPGWPSLQMAI